LESARGSIVGASECLYAQRRSICKRFEPGLAPDFLSVLRTVELGLRAVVAPGAVGTMRPVRNAADEFRRKVRTVLRGITTLHRYRRLLNPWRHRSFAMRLWSHKVARWLAPLFLVITLVSSALLAPSSAFFAGVLIIHLVAMALAGLSGLGRLGQSLLVRVAAYVVVSNAAIGLAWLEFARGRRQELWSPSKR